MKIDLHCHTKKTQKSDGINRNVDENFSVAYLKFTNKMEKDKHYEYLETTGEMALEKFRPQTIYLIIGLMIGSLYAIVMGPTTLEVPQDPMSIGTFSIIFFAIGGAIIFGLQKLKDVLEKKE